MARAFWTDSGQASVHECYESLLRQWPVPFTRRVVPTCEGDTFVISCGNETGLPLVLLHGGMATSAMWSRSVPAWGERFQIYAVDLIGDAGLSAASRPSMSSDAHALWLDDVLKELNIDTASMVGASLGGWVALDYAIRRTNRLDRLALLAPGGVSRIRLGFVLKVAPLLLLGPWGHRRALGLDMGFDSAEETSSAGQAFVSFFQLVQQHFIARTKPIPTFSNAALSRVTIPVLAILGGQDAFFDPEVTKQRLHSFVPNSTVKVLPNAGHGLVDCTEDVMQFLLHDS